MQIRGWTECQRSFAGGPDGGTEPEENRAASPNRNLVFVPTATKLDERGYTALGQ
jgi:hypothetical protein